MSQPMAQIETTTEAGTLRFRLRGEVDLSNAQALQAEMQAAIRESDCRRVTVDLSAVDYIDSQGVMLLLEVASTLRAAARPLELVAPPDSVAGELLTIAHLGDLPVERRSHGD